MNEKTMESLRYTDEPDRCLGATGMAIAMVVLNGEDMLAAVNIDAAPDEIIEFDPEYYFEGNPGLLAGNAWRRLLSNYNLTSGLLVGNVLCRRMVGALRLPADDEKSYLRDIIVEEGENTCSLEAEEAETLFDRNYQRFYRLFSNRGVHSLAHDFATLLAEHRTLSRTDVLMALRPLRML